MCPSAAGSADPVRRSDELDIRLDNLTVVNNSAASAGGGISIIHQAGFSGRRVAWATLSRSTVSGNVAVAGSGGGGLFASNATRLDLDRVAFDSNAARSSRGGAVSAAFLLGLSVRNSSFTANSGFGGGGALAASFCPLTLAANTFAGNRGGAGGAVLASQSPLLNASHCLFQGNAAMCAECSGGAIAAVNVTSVVLNRVDFVGNAVVPVAAQYAGQPMGVSTPTQRLFAWPLGVGGAVLLQTLGGPGGGNSSARPSVLISHGTMIGNSAFAGGGAMALVGPATAQARVRLCTLHALLLSCAIWGAVQLRRSFVH